jgi:hypothetical protein
MLGQHNFTNGYIIGVSPTLGQHTFANGYIIGVGKTLGQHTFKLLWTFVNVALLTLLQNNFKYNEIHLISLFRMCTICQKITVSKKMGTKSSPGQTLFFCSPIDEFSNAQLMNSSCIIEI